MIKIIFWIFVILTALGTVVAFKLELIKNKLPIIEGFNLSRQQKFEKFKRQLIGDTLTLIRIISIFNFAVVSFMVSLIFAARVTADGIKESRYQQYNALMYKAETESIRDDFGIVNKEYIDEVQSWNEELAKNKAYSNNIWIGIFYPRRTVDGLSIINLEDIKIKQ